jgi:hypothetical protein
MVFIQTPKGFMDKSSGRRCILAAVMPNFNLIIVALVTESRCLNAFVLFLSLPSSIKKASSLSASFAHSDPPPPHTPHTNAHIVKTSKRIMLVSVRWFNSNGMPRFRI